VVAPETLAGVERDRLHQGDAVRRGTGAGKSSGLLGHPAPRLDHVEADDLDPGGHEQPHDELTDQAETDDACHLAQLRLRATYALHGDGTHGREGGLLRGDPVRNAHAEVHRHPVELGVQGELVAGRGDDVSHGELVDARTDLDDDTGEGVAERGVAVELVHRLLVGGHRPLLGHGVEQLLDLVGSGPSLADQGEPGLRDLHHLGARGDQRVERAHQHSARPARRRRGVEHHELTGLVVLRDLLHLSPDALP
jgi:hypothetical protein